MTITTKIAEATALEAVSTPLEAAGLASLRLDGQGPVWLQIRRALARPIMDGKWGPGTRIPGEMDLSAFFRTSRMTVNKAIQSLANEGLLLRRRKVGTVVSARAQERPTFEIWDTSDIVDRAGGAYGYQLLECAFVRDDAEKRALLNVSQKTQLLWMRSLHLSDGAPFQLEERLINVDAAPGVTCQPLETVAPTAWLLAHVPWTQGEHTISATEAGPEVAGVLGLTHGAACLMIERRTWNGDVPVTYARLWHPGARHRLVGRIQRSC
jgi:GntR family histidine utilization transcriptional repressor